MPTAPILAPERDGLAALGRGKYGSTTPYCVPGVAWTTMSTLIGNNGTDWYEPWFTPTPIVIDMMASEVTTLEAGKNFRIGFYKADKSWQPIGPPLADSGNISSASTGVKTYTPGTAIYVPRGRYVSVRNGDSGTNVFRVAGGVFPGIPLDVGLGASAQVQAMQATRAFAAFPTPGAAWTAVTTAAAVFRWAVFYRVSSP